MKQLAAGAAIVGAAALVALGSAPAQAEPVPVDPGIGAGEGHGVLFLEIERGDGTVEDQALLCPGGFGHERGAEACSHLSAVHGDFTALAPTAVWCTFEYAPVTLRAQGFWEGRVVSWEREFANDCVGRSATGGAVFDFA
ncbi:SSI family serine proteinase inhibitor [Glycomyces paridis]|uniref:Serine protease n=1 Tax=Glycomyces paridis TaxID=2126555 RepID=A0A4S8PKX2_9ACTN|nr:SSI family serine proteinase inhibitor [Glycomyces paridis]THV28944.1 serine protease [Glycomyces paridis]